MIRHSRPDFDESDLRAIENVLRSGDVSSGEELGEVEALVAKKMDKKFALTFNSWTSAAFSFFLLLAKERPNSKVIIPSFSFTATANVIVNAGLQPVFADINLDDGSLDLDSVERLIDDEVSAVMIVHYAGIFAKHSTEIRRLCEERGIVFVEDAAEALGSFSGSNLTAGSLGVGIFSLFATKNISSGEGGIITLDDENLFINLKLIRGHGVQRNLDHPWQRNAELAGHNFRMSNLNASLALSQLKRLDKLNAKRIEIAKLYIAELEKEKWVRVLGTESTNLNSWQMLPIFISSSRNEVVYRLLDAGIEASVHFDPPIHQQSAYKSIGTNSALTNTVILSNHVITLPMHPNLSKSEVLHVTSKLVEIGEALNLH